MHEVATRESKRTDGGLARAPRPSSSGGWPRNISGAGVASADLLRMQRAVGNRAVVSLVGRGAVSRMHDPTIGDANASQAASLYITQQRGLLLPPYKALLGRVRGGQNPTDQKALVTGIKNVVDQMATKPAKPVMNDAGRLLQGQPTQGADVDGAISLAVRTLNAMEQELATDAALNTSVDRTLMGTEFTFSDGKPDTEPTASIRLQLVAPAKRTADQKKPHEKAQTTIYQWTEYVKSTQIVNVPKPTVAAVQDGKGEYAKRVDYVFPDTTTWWWKADIDEGCYETQTQPTASGDLTSGKVNSIIESHIFGGAAAKGLTVDRTARGGGGHLSMDVSSSVGGTVRGTAAESFELLLTILDTLQANAANLGRQWREDSGEGGVGEADPKNAPWLKDENLKIGGNDALAPYRDMVSDAVKRALAGGLTDIVALTDELIAYNQRLVNPTEMPTSDRQHIHEPDNISHYQAVNIEHLKEDDAAARRVEMRDIPAQGGVVTLKRDLAVLAEAIEMARSQVRAEQEFRLA
jgi:hypothetical protein